VDKTLCLGNAEQAGKQQHDNEQKRQQRPLGAGGGEAAHLPLQLRMPLTRLRGNATREPTRASPTHPRAASKYPKLFQSHDQEEQ
jgi:hypothetical protein